MIIANYPTFRWVACNKIVSAPTATFTDANPDTIARTDLGGDWTADGVEAGMVTQFTGTANNDGVLYTVDTLAAALLTLDAGDAVVGEVAIACAQTSYWLDSDGYEEFPGPFGHTNLVRSGGFSGGITGMPQPWTNGTTTTLTVNATTADAVPHTDEYHWYLSQRSDDPAKQYISIAQYADPVAPGNTYSGSVTIAVSALGYAESGMLAGNPTPTTVAEVFRHCHIYCIRVADGSIQWLDLLREAFGA